MEHANECRVKLVWLNKDRNGVRKVIEPITMSRTNLSYPVFGDRPETDFNQFAQFINSKSGEKFHCDIGNRTSDLVMVLDDAYADGTYYYTNTVWLPGDNYRVGAWGSGIRACFRFAVFRVGRPQISHVFDNQR